jgi:hypothetical protein
MRMAATVMMTAMAAAASADEVRLRGGGRIVGDVVSDSGGSLVVSTGPGTVTVPRAQVESIVGSPVALTEYRRRSTRLSAGDVAGWTALARWAERSELATQARDAWRHVVAADPRNAAARQALGHVLYQGRWMEFDAAQRARGLVEAEGVWMPPTAREALAVRREAVRERSAIAQLAWKEAEARTREAEARARVAEIQADCADSVDCLDAGIPFGDPGYGEAFVGGFGSFGFGRGLGVRRGPGYPYDLSFGPGYTSGTRTGPGYDLAFRPAFGVGSGRDGLSFHPRPRPHPGHRDRSGHPDFKPRNRQRPTADRGPSPRTPAARLTRRAASSPTR